MVRQKKKREKCKHQSKKKKKKKKAFRFEGEKKRKRTRMNFNFLPVLLFFLAVGCPVLSLLVVEDFEKNGVDNWRGLDLSSDIKHSGNYSGCWTNKSAYSHIWLNLSTIGLTDWTPYSLFSIWIYNDNPDNVQFVLYLDSGNASTAGNDYYAFFFNTDWTGWKEFKRLIPTGFSPFGSPVGWNKLVKLDVYYRFSTTPKLCFDDVTLSLAAPSFGEKVDMHGALVPGFQTRFQVPMKGLESNNKRTTLSATIVQGSEFIESAVWADNSKSITAENYTFTPKDNECIFRVVNLTNSQAVASGKGKTVKIEFCMRVAGGLEEDRNCWSFIGEVNPDPAVPVKPHPFMLFTESEVARLKQQRTEKNWVDYQLRTIENYHLYYVNYDFSVPKGVTRSNAYYICPDGTYLEFNVSSPFSHYCPSDRKEYTGEKYDSAWKETKHRYNFDYAQRLALNYLFFKNETVFGILKELLLEYSRDYLSSPYHEKTGIDNLFPASGARIMSETLTESNKMIKAALIYDFIYQGLSREEKSYIEFNLLRPVYATIVKYNGGKSNVQSWHNYSDDSPGSGAQ